VEVVVRAFLIRLRGYGLAVVRLARRLPRSVRVSAYSGGYAAIVALIAAGRLPGWTAAIGSPLLLAVLNLTPKDIEK
jgi:hypothetical protein